MGIITRMLKSTAVYWAPSGQRDKFGNPILLDPVELQCRREDTNLQFTDLRGELRISNAIFYVSADVALGGYLWEGALADAPDNPMTYEGAFEIKQFGKLPKLNYREYLRTAMV